MTLKSVEDSIVFYLDKKKKGELSLGEIRAELKRQHYTEADINAICKAISDAELTALLSEKKPLLSFLDHAVVSYIFLIASVCMIACCLYYLNWLYSSDPEFEKYSKIMHIAPYIFIGGASMMAFKHWRRIKKTFRGKTKG